MRITQLSQEVEALRLAIPQFPRRAAPSPVDPRRAGRAGRLPPSTPARATPPPPVALAPGMSPQRLYNTALADFTAGQWALCIEGFDTYLRSFPRSELADDAQWYIGECYQQDGKFTEAIDAYNRVITNYPEGRSRAGRLLQARHGVRAPGPDRSRARIVRDADEELSRPRHGAAGQAAARSVERGKPRG